jgi:nitrite reductase (cytochrome c-552)
VYLRVFVPVFQRRLSGHQGELQRKAQWRLDFVAAENSMGFHAPQEMARILGESIDYSRQAQLAKDLKATLAAASAQPSVAK